MKNIFRFIWKWLKPVIVLLIAIYSLKWLFVYAIMYGIMAIIIGKANGESNLWWYLWSLAISLDQTLNVLLQHVLNDILIKNISINMFGNPDETISGVMGKNQLNQTLTWFGRLVNLGLSRLDKNHSIKSIEYDE